MPNHTVTSDYVIEIRQLDVKASLIEKQSEALGASGATPLHFPREKIYSSQKSNWITSQILNQGPSAKQKSKGSEATA